MDAYACSSESEGMSNALLEGMASGLPIVATDVGDHASIVRERVEGLIVPSGCIGSFGNAIRLLASTPSLRERFGAAARVRVDRYDFGRTVRVYERWYESLLVVPSGQRPSNVIAAG